MAPIGSAIGTWPRLDGAPEPTKFGSKNYDKNRKKMAQFLGLDFLFTEREYCQSIQTDSTGTKVLVNSNKRGELLAVKPVPNHLLNKPWFTRRLRNPRQYLGIPRIEERVGKLSHLLHLVTQRGIPSRAFAKSLSRLSMTWCTTRYENMRKHVASLTRKVRLEDKTRNPWMRRSAYPNPPVFTGVKIHENGIEAPLWCRSLSVKKGISGKPGTSSTQHIT